MGKLNLVNTLQAGQLPEHEANNPSSPRFANGLLIANGARFVGGRVTHANGTTKSSQHLFRTDFVPYPDGRTYLRNTDKTADDTSSTLPSDTAAGTSESLNDQLDRFLNNQTALASAGISDLNYRSTGKYDKFTNGLTWVNARLASSTGDVIYVSKDIKYCRAVVYTDPRDSVQYWSVLARKKLWVRDEWRGHLFDGWHDDRKDKTGNYPITIAHGKEFNSRTKRESDLSGADSRLTANIEIQPIIYTIKRGWYKPTSSISLYLVGKMMMFRQELVSNTFYPIDPKEYSLSSGELGSKNNSVSVDTNDKRQSQGDLEDVYVLRWATATEDQITYANLETGSDPVQALDAQYGLTSQPPGAITKKFYFQTARNKVSRLRRVGIAHFVDSTGTAQPTNGERDFYVGFTKLAAAAGDGANTTIGTSATDAYIASIGGKPMWIELGYQGVFAGTSDGEYIISNEQSATDYTIQKISSVGAGQSGTDYIDASTSIDGIIWFITRRGIAHLQFSNESQTFIPIVIDIIDMGFSKPKSISSSKTIKVLIVCCEDGTVLQIDPITGAVSTISVSNPGTDSTLYDLVGTCTEDGESKFVWISAGVYYQSFLDSNSKISTTIVTTSFGQSQETNVKINKVFISMSKSLGGKVRIYGQDDSKWVDIPYTPEDLQLGYFSGIKEIPIYDSVQNKNTGKQIEVIFDSQDQMNISYISVSGEI